MVKITFYHITLLEYKHYAASWETCDTEKEAVEYMVSHLSCEAEGIKTFDKLDEYFEEYGRDDKYYPQCVEIEIEIENDKVIKKTVTNMT